MVFATAGFQGNNLKAIRLDGAKGDITGTPSIVWEINRDTPYVPSPLLYDNIQRRSTGGRQFEYERRRIYTTVTYGF